MDMVKKKGEMEKRKEKRKEIKRMEGSELKRQKKKEIGVIK